MKKFLVVLVACAMIFAFASTALAAEQIPEFSDLGDQSQAVVTAVEKLAILGVLEGDAGLDGPYRPTENVTRGEFAKIVCYLAGVQKNANSLQGVASRFPDVSTDEWFNGWVNGATAAGFFMGDDNGNFRPYDNVTMAEVATVVLRIVGYDENLPGDWPANYGNKASSVGVLDDVDYQAYAPATRADVAVLCEAVLDLNMVVYVGGSDISAWLIGQGDADKDGYAEQSYVSNEITGETRFIDILEKSFDAFAYDVQMAFSDAFHDEVAGWRMDDFDDNDFSLRIDGLVDPDNDGDMISYNDDEEIGALYYITRGYDFVDLAGMQAEIVVQSDKIVFVDPFSSFELAAEIYAEAGDRINVGGKSVRASDTAVFTDGNGSYGSAKSIFAVTDAKAIGSGNADYISYYDHEVKGITASDKDNTFAGKVYYDENGRVYAVKSYYQFKDNAFGIYDELNGSEVLYKNGSPLDWDTEEDYLIYRDGERIAIEDLDANDLIYHLGDVVGVDFYLAFAPQTGDMTTQNKAKSGGLVKISDVEYPDDSNFQFSDDAGIEFSTFHLDTHDIAKESFGDVEYAPAYYFYEVAYVASMNSAAKLYGVVDSLGSNVSWSTGNATPDYKSITITDAEGKEVTYSLTSKLSKELNKLYGNRNPVGMEYINPNSTFHAVADGEAIQEGDLVQLVLDSNDNVKKIEKYAAMDPDWYTSFGADPIEVTVNKSRSRISYTAGTSEYHVLNSDAVIFQVSLDSNGDFDSVDVVSLDTLLSADFDASQLIAFDANSADKLLCFYYIGESTSRSFAVLTDVVREGAYDDYGLFFDGAAAINGDSPAGTTPYDYRKHFVVYKEGSSASILQSLVNANGYTTNVGDLYDGVKSVDEDYDVFKATTVAYSNNKLTVNNIEASDVTIDNPTASYFFNRGGSYDVDIYSSTYLYDLSDAALKTSDLNKADYLGRDVVVVVDKTSQALYVLYLAVPQAPAATNISSSNGGAVVSNVAHTVTLTYAYGNPLTVGGLKAIITADTATSSLKYFDAATGGAEVVDATLVNTGVWIEVTDADDNKVRYEVIVTPANTNVGLTISDADVAKAETGTDNVWVANPGTVAVTALEAALAPANALSSVDVVLSADGTSATGNVNATTMVIRVTAESGAHKDYTIVLKSNVTTLNVTGKTGDFTYTADNVNYELKIEDDNSPSLGTLSDLTTDVEATADPAASYKVMNGTSEVTTGTDPITASMKIVVTAEYGNTQTYDIVDGN